jgi:hypothetical protein
MVEQRKNYTLAELTEPSPIFNIRQKLFTIRNVYVDDAQSQWLTPTIEYVTKLARNITSIETNYGRTLECDITADRTERKISIVPLEQTIERMNVLHERKNGIYLALEQERAVMRPMQEPGYIVQLFYEDRRTGEKRAA